MNNHRFFFALLILAVIGTSSISFASNGSDVDTVPLRSLEMAKKESFNNLFNNFRKDYYSLSEKHGLMYLGTQRDSAHWRIIANDMRSLFVKYRTYFENLEWLLEQDDETALAAINAYPYIRNLNFRCYIDSVTSDITKPGVITQAFMELTNSPNASVARQAMYLLSLRCVCHDCSLFRKTILTRLESDNPRDLYLALHFMYTDAFDMEFLNKCIVMASKPYNKYQEGPELISEFTKKAAEYLNQLSTSEISYVYQKTLLPLLPNFPNFDKRGPSCQSILWIFFDHLTKDFSSRTMYMQIFRIASEKGYSRSIGYFNSETDFSVSTKAITDELLQYMTSANANLRFYSAKCIYNEFINPEEPKFYPWISHGLVDTALITTFTDLAVNAVLLKHDYQLIVAVPRFFIRLGRDELISSMIIALQNCPRGTPQRPNYEGNKVAFIYLNSGNDMLSKAAVRWAAEAKLSVTTFRTSQSNSDGMAHWGKALK